MSPPTSDPLPEPYLTTADAGYAVYIAGYHREQAKNVLQARQVFLEDALLDAVLYAGMDRAALARILNCSRRQIGRMLRSASGDPEERLASTSSSLGLFPNL